MTSQVIILTKRNAIFVSDRQQTMADGKTYGGIQKIFEISDIHSSAIMINGKADFGDVPVETLIEEFSVNTNFRQIATIEEIKDELVNFLSKHTDFSSTDEYIKEILKQFKQNISFNINDIGFEEAIGKNQRKDIPPFIKNYSNYADEFKSIIPKRVR